MKQVIAALFVIITIISLFVIAFTVNQVGEEEQRLKSDLQYRSTLLTESLKSIAHRVCDNYSQILVVGNDPNDQEAVEGSGLSVTTSPDTLTADYYTEGKLELGGEELVDRLLDLVLKRKAG